MVGFAGTTWSSGTKKASELESNVESSSVEVGCIGEESDLGEEDKSRLLDMESMLICPTEASGCTVEESEVMTDRICDTRSDSSGSNSHK